MEKEKMEKDSKNLNTERVPPRPLKPKQRTQINIGPTGHNSSKKKNNYPISKELLRQPEPPLPPPRRLTGPFGPSGQPQASRRQTGPSSFKNDEPLYEIPVPVPVPVESVESVEPLYEIPVPVPVAINNRQKRPKMPLPRIKKNNRK
jgi:hypothetical protein